jgi:hypothetical protein
VVEAWSVEDVAGAAEETTTGLSDEERSSSRGRVSIGERRWASLAERCDWVKGDAMRTYEVTDVAGASVSNSKAKVQRKPNVNSVRGG